MADGWAAEGGWTDGGQTDGGRRAANGARNNDGHIFFCVAPPGDDFNYLVSHPHIQIHI